MRQAVELRLRRARDDQRLDSRGLGGHDVHHHAGRVDGVAARHVEPDPLDRHPALGHRRAGRERRGGVGASLVGVHRAGTLDRYLECGADVRRQLIECVLQVSRRHPDLRGTHAVERLAELQGRLSAARGDRVDDRADRRQHRVHVHAASRQRRPQAGSRQLGGAQIDAGHDR